MWSARFIALSILCLLHLSGWAQKTEKHKIRYRDTSAIRQLNLNIALFRPMISHSGYKLGFEYPLLTFRKEKQKRNGVHKQKERQYFATANLGGFYHRRHQLGLFLNTELAFRNTGNKGFVKECFAGIGYLRTFLPNPTYQVNDQGEVSRKRLAGHHYFIPILSFGVGKSLQKLLKKPVTFHLKQSTFLYIPENYLFAGNFALEFGVTYRNLNNFFLKKNHGN